MSTVRQNNADIDPERVSLRGKVQRMVVTLTTKALWQVLGYTLGRGGAQQVLNAEPFTGIGIAARPPSSGKPECIVVMTGNDGKTPVIVAVRDEKTRAAVAAAIGLALDETVLFNSAACVHVKADGTVELKHPTPSGAVEKMVKGETYRTNEDLMLTQMGACVLALKAVLTALDTYANAIKGIADPTSGNPATTELHTALVTVATPVLDTTKAAIDTFKAAAASYLATVGKVE